MMNKLKRLLCFAVATVLAITLMAGCSENPRDDVTPPVTTPATAAPDVTSGDVTVPPPPAEDDITDAPQQTEPEPAKTEEITTLKEETEMTTTEPTTAATTTEATTTSPAYTVEPASGKMYATADVNVRSGPDTTYERVGHLDAGDEVEITGVADTGWYRIKFKDGEYFVSASYLSAEKPAAPVTTAATTAATTASTAAAVQPTVDHSSDVWITTWGTAVMPPDGDDKIPSKPALANNTVRQQIRVSAGGYKVRLVLSNEQGSSELKIEKMTLAKLLNPSKPDVDLDTLTTVTYNGKTSFSIPAGKRITTDEIEFEFAALTDIAITMKLGSVPSTLTCHTASRCYTWTVAGDHTSDNSYSSFDRKTSWYFIAALETLAPKGSGTIVTLGDSLTDGASISDNSFARYSDQLAKRLKDDENLSNYGVAAMGIGGTALCTFNSPIDGKNRVSRDVLNVTGVKYLILMMGTNDIGYSWNDVSNSVINEYKNIIKKCHDKGIKVIGMTIPPNKGSGHYSEDKEKQRLKVNQFILSDNSGFDLVIDISSEMASKNDAAKMDEKYVSTSWHDWLHFNETGYKHIGDTVYENIKDFIAKEN